MNPKDIQSEYYTKTAGAYETMHHPERSEHTVAREYILEFARMKGAKDILDVGCGTGFNVKFFLDHGLSAKGVEPVRALIEEGVKSGVPAGALVQGSGDKLPFPDGSFDFVSEFAVLHHVERPNRIVREMMRVARKGVFLSDSNRFGQGRFAARLVKLALWKLRLWPLYIFAKTRGKKYFISEGDGLFYSYSVFDSYATLSEWADTVVLVPTDSESGTGWFSPLLTSSKVLVAAFKA